MMRTILSLLCLLLCLGASAQKKKPSGLSPIPTEVEPLTDKYDYYDHNTFPSYKVDEVTDLGGYMLDPYTTIRMKRTKKATYLTATYRMSRWRNFFIFNKNKALVDRATGKRYPIQYVEDYPLHTFFWVQNREGGHVRFTLVFPPLPKEVKTIDYVSTDLPSRTWFDGKATCVYNIDVAKLCALDPNGEPVTNLTDEPGLTGKQWFAARGIADDAIPSDNPTLPKASWELGQTTVRIHLLSDNRPQETMLKVTATDIFDVTTSHKVRVGEDGVGELSFKQYGPAQAITLLSEGRRYIGGALLEPGKTTDIYVDQNSYGNDRLAGHEGAADNRQSGYHFYTNGLYRDVNFTMNIRDFLMSNLLMSYDRSKADYTQSPDACVDSIIGETQRSLQRIASSSLPPFTQKMLSLAARQRAVWALGITNTYRGLDYEKKMGQSSFPNYWDSDHALGEKQVKRLHEAIDITDPELLSGPLFSQYINGITENRRSWVEYAGVTKGELHDVVEAHRYYYIAKEGRLTEALRDSLRSLSTPTVRQIIMDMNDSVVHRYQAVEHLDLIEPTPEVADSLLFQTIMAPHKGKTVLVDFWNTWCTPCRQAMAELAPYKEKELKSDNLVWIYIADETSPLTAYKPIIAELPGLHYRLTNAQWKQVCKQLGIESIPAYVLMKADGTFELRKDLRQTEALVKELKEILGH